MKKRVYVALSHHHVIKEWFRYRGCGVHLLSFDFHTDFREAFISNAGDPSANYAYSRERHNLYLNKHIPCENVEAAISDLKNDEHIDFAIRSGMIERAFVFSHNDWNRDGVLVVPSRKKQIVPPRRGIVSYSEAGHPMINPPYDDSQMAKMAKLVTDDEVLADVLKTFCECGFDQSNYILDFDCDFIRDRDAMSHGQFQTLKYLIKGAKAITIAAEPYCVADCSGQTLTSDEIEDWLLGLIQDCGGDIEIEYE